MGQLLKRIADNNLGFDAVSITHKLLHPGRDTVVPAVHGLVQSGYLGGAPKRRPHQRDTIVEDSHRGDLGASRGRQLSRCAQREDRLRTAVDTNDDPPKRARTSPELRGCERNGERSALKDLPTGMPDADVAVRRRASAPEDDKLHALGLSCAAKRPRR
jgi:hypothetical protein